MLETLGVLLPFNTTLVKTHTSMRCVCVGRFALQSVAITTVISSPASVSFTVMSVRSGDDQRSLIHKPHTV